jgi:hypothetical protein
MIGMFYVKLKVRWDIVDIVVMSSLDIVVMSSLEVLVVNLVEAWDLDLAVLLDDDLLLAGEVVEDVGGSLVLFSLLLELLVLLLHLLKASKLLLDVLVSRSDLCCDMFSLHRNCRKKAFGC